MFLKVYSIFDSKVEAFMQPFYCKSKGEAIRSITEAVNDPKTSLSKYPEDFTLFELGSWDDSNCKFGLHSTPYSLGLLVEFKKVIDVKN